MFTCFEGLLDAPVYLYALVFSILATAVMFWTLRLQRFPGKHYCMLTYIGVIWTLMMVGSDGATPVPACKQFYSALTWLGYAMAPVAWCFFTFAYVHSADGLRRREKTLALILLPLTIFTFVATNSWHQLVYIDVANAPPGAAQYRHGPGYYLIVAVIYPFVMATLYCLLRAYGRASPAAWPLLTMLIAITVTPLVTNSAYVLFGFTVYGLDPTALTFALGILAFSWLALANKTMDMPTVGQSTLFDRMSEPVVLLDRQRRVVRSNAAARDSGLLTHSQLGPDLLTGIDRLAQQGTAQITCGARIYEPRVQPIDDPLNPEGAGIGWSVTFVDETDRIAATHALEKALQNADDANRAKDEFISVVSHELRTPLTSLKGGLALALSGKLGAMDAQVRGSLNIAHRNGLRLSRLVDNILLAQKLDVQALNLEWQPVDLHRLLTESLEENQMFAEERGVRLVTGQIDAPAVVLGDAFAIRQVVDNLISNAIKFSEKGGVVEGVLRANDGQVRLSISDQGRGIPAGSEEEVFGRFGQVADGVQKSTQGSGLGLHISRQLARQMAGDLFYESTLGAGSVFHVEFGVQSNQDGAPRSGRMQKAV
ncbi:histidine kinase N-terminal 7TM domain-containing protein [Sulfitobacter sp. PS-8MA]|uniref:sensor histidine kinase n=1 Tax=Sulfitobacter sp. PS-8MA TaxID=3237707 RepID=UPI0034C68EC6